MKLIWLLPGSTWLLLAFQGSWGENKGRQEQQGDREKGEGAGIWTEQATGITK